MQPTAVEENDGGKAVDAAEQRYEGQENGEGGETADDEEPEPEAGFVRFHENSLAQRLGRRFRLGAERWPIAETK